MNALEFCNEIEQMMGYDLSSTLAGTQTKELRDVVQASNKVLTNMQGDKEWRELTVDGHIAMGAARSHTNDIAVTYGSTLFQSVASIFTAADVGSMLQVSGNRVTYRIAAFIAANQVTLDRPWVEDTIANVENEVFIGQDTFEMPTNYDRMLDKKFYNPVGDNYITLVDPKELNVQRQTNGLGLSVGIPTKCAIHGMNTTGTAYKIHFDMAVQFNTDLDFQYLRKHDTLDADATLISYPDKDLLYIMDTVKARLDRDNEASQTAGQLAAEAMSERNKTQQNHESGNSAVRMTPFVRQTGRRRRR